jgi:hypothetical protein
MNIETISTSPYICRIYNFITPQEIALIKKYAPTLQTHLETNGKLDRHFQHATYPSLLTDPRLSKISDKIKQQIIQLTQTTDQYIHHIQILKYQKGHFTQLHYDAQATFIPFSFVICLRAHPNETGGGIYFPKLNLTLQSIPGSAVMWRNHEKGSKQIDARMEHQGSAPVRGVKYSLAVFVTGPDGI